MIEKREQVKWTPEMDAIVAKMLADKCTSAQIGKAVGVTRNAVIGRVNRAKKLRAVGFHRKPGYDRPKMVKPAAVIKPRVVVRVSPSIFNEPVPVRKPIQISSKDRTTTVGRPLMLMGSCMCRWAVNDADKGGLHLFCGAAADGPYCEKHARKSIGRGTEGERTADRVLAKAA